MATTSYTGCPCCEETPLWECCPEMSAPLTLTVTVTGDRPSCVPATFELTWNGVNHESPLITDCFGTGGGNLVFSCFPIIDLGTGLTTIDWYFGGSWTLPPTNNWTSGSCSPLEVVFTKTLTSNFLDKVVTFTITL